MKSLYVGAAAVVAAWSCGALAQTASAQTASAPTIDGWSIGQPYVRADAGGAFSTSTHFKSDDPDAANALLPPGGHIGSTMGAAGAFDLGIGTRVTPYLRLDTTLSYIPAMRFSGTDNLGADSVETANVDSLVGMVNTYLDFAGLAPGLFGPFQPYIDGGVGAASNHIGNMGSTLGAGNIAGNTNTSLAWGVGAGVGIGIGPNTTLDVSYKYLDLGEARTGISDSTGGSISPLKANLRTNTIMVGLRVGL